MIAFLKSFFTPFTIHEPTSTEWAFALKLSGYVPSFRYGPRRWTYVDGRMVQR